MYYFFVFVGQGPPVDPQTLGYFQCSWLPYGTRQKDHMAESVTCLSHRICQVSALREASSLLTNVHAAGRCYAHCWRAKVVTNLMHL